MAIYRGVGGSGDSATGEDVFGDNSSITSLNGLSGAIQTPTYIKFASDAAHTASQGELTWNTDEGTLDLGLNHGGVVLQIGQEQHYRVTNQSGADIPNGTLVSFVGTTGNSGKLLIDVYDGSQASKTIIGLTTEDILNGANGYVTCFGKVRGIQTNGANYGETWVDGDILYPSPSGLTKTLPQAPAAKSPIAVVVNSHVSNGELFVRVQGSTTIAEDELVQLASLTDGDVLQYDGVQARFENRSLSAAGILPTSAIGTTVQAYDSNLTSFVSTFTLPTTDSTNGYVLTTNGAGTLSFAAASGGVADGDKGDITVSVGGSVWTVDNDAITTAKLGGDITLAGKALLDDASAADQRTTLGVTATGADTTYAFRANNLSDLANAGTARTNLGLGVIATQGDGDKGDITVSASGATWTIDNNVVTYAKMQDVSATSRILGRKTAAAGDTEECTLSEVLDFVGSAAQGDILYRGAATWARLGAGTSGQYLKTNGAAANPSWATVATGLTLGTPVATTSGTAIDFGSLPAGIKQITVTVTDVSFSSTVALGFRLGTGGTPQTTGYDSSYGAVSVTANTTSGATSSVGVLLPALTTNTHAYSGSITFTIQDASTNTWAGSGTFKCTSATVANIFVSGFVSLSGTLDIIRLYGGTFDAGKANIAYIS